MGGFRRDNEPRVLVGCLSRDSVVRGGALLGIIVLVLLSCLTGCTRRYFRTEADAEVQGIFNEKNVFEQWRVEDFYVYPSPLARFADWTNPDRPPMPPDDPGAWLLSPRPQRPKRIAYIEGTAYLDILAAWDEQNRANQPNANQPAAAPPVEKAKPQWIVNPGCDAAARLQAWAGRKEPFLITLDQALELSWFNSRDFQNRREQLYLAALPVTFERFAFLPQFEANNQTIREWAGKETEFGKQNRWLTATELGVSKKFATGALLLLQLANQTTINLTGGNKHTLSSSTLLLELSQPLLQGGGRAVTLEPLTQTERDFLYDLRDFAHFHRELYVSIAAGGAPQAGGGGVFSVQGQPATIGYIPTLQRLSRLRLSRRNEESLRRILSLYQSYAEAGVVSRLQVDQVEQDLLSAQVSRLRLQAAYSDGLDQFKVQLGLPTDLPLVLDYAQLQPLQDQFDAYDKIQNDYNVLVEAVEALGKKETAPRELRKLVRHLLAESDLVKGTQLQKQILERLERWEKLNDTSANVADSLSRLLPLPLANLPGQLLLPSQPSAAQIRIADLKTQRRKLLDEQDEFERKEVPVPLELRNRIRDLTLEIDAGTLELQMSQFELEPWKTETRPVRIGPFEVLIPNLVRQRIIRNDLFRRAINSLSITLEEVRVERYEYLTTTWRTLPPTLLQGVDLLKSDEDEVLQLVGQTALTNRLDLMNQRGLLNDAWRQIAVTANSLMGVFDVRYNMRVSTPPAEFAQPLNFEGERSRHTLEFNSELPLVRKLEQNNYRRSLISYQRQRRALMLAEDSVLFQVRQEIRQLRQLAESFETQKRIVALAYLRAEIALETFQQPPAPGETRDSASAAAALTDQILNAQSRLVAAQNSMVDIWVTYVTNRMRLYKDLELLQVDTRGVWINEYAAPEPAPDRQP